MTIQYVQLQEWQDRLAEPPPPRKIFSSDLGESHGLAGLGLGARAPRAPRGYATGRPNVQI